MHASSELQIHLLPSAIGKEREQDLEQVQSRNEEDLVHLHRELLETHAHVTTRQKNNK